jgi:hypothetical protein
VTSGQLNASTPSITLAMPTDAGAIRSRGRRRPTSITLANPPATMLTPATIAMAWMVIPAHATTKIPALIQPRPITSRATPVFSGDASSPRPLAMKLPATITTSTPREVNGRSVRTAAIAAQASPSSS